MMKQFSHITCVTLMVIADEALLADGTRGWNANAGIMLDNGT